MTEKSVQTMADEAIRNNAVVSSVFKYERRRGFQPPWYWVKHFVCLKCRKETVLRISVRLTHLPKGAILCDCGNQLPLS